MGDALRPRDDEFKQVLQESFRIWSSYLAAEADQDLLPPQAIDMKPLVTQTPPFLGDGIALSDGAISFACEEKVSVQGRTSLFVCGRPT